MDRPADELRGSRAQHLRGCGIDEVDAPGGIGSEDAIGHRSEDQLVLLVKLAHPAFLGRTRHELPDGRTDRFHRGHGLDIFLTALPAEQLDRRNNPIADPHRDRPSGGKTVVPSRLPAKEAGIFPHVDNPPRRAQSPYQPGKSLTASEGVRAAFA